MKLGVHAQYARSECIKERLIWHHAPHQPEPRRSWYAVMLRNAVQFTISNRFAVNFQWNLNRIELEQNRYINDSNRDLNRMLYGFVHHRHVEMTTTDKSFYRASAQAQRDCYGKSVCLSVCPSHAGIVLKLTHL